MKHCGRGICRGVAMALLILLGVHAAQTVAATACGSNMQRGCCVASSERLSTGACYSGHIEVPGCSGDCSCGGSGLAPFFGSSSSSHCEVVTACGGLGQRACCITEGRWNDNPIPFSGGCRYDAATSGVNGLTEIAGGPGKGQLCGGSNPFRYKSNGTCVKCGTEGAHACVGVAQEDECVEGLTNIAGYCNSCGGEDMPICDAETASPTCLPGFHPNTGVCTADTVIAEPDCDCDISARAVHAASEPVVGYADLHLHTFSNLAFGGLTVWGDAFDPNHGISQALRADNFAIRTADRVINGNVISGIDADVVPVDVFRKQTSIHSDLHLLDFIGHGTGQGLTANGGVEWDPEHQPDRSPLHFSGWPKWSSTTHQQSYYKWLERAHKGGLQLIVMFAVNNEAMCASGKRFDDVDFKCEDTMAGIRLQLTKARELEDWLDAQCAGGVEDACALNLPSGEKAGWFEVVESPAEARNAIAKGQLAVVLGIEESTLFGCKDGVCTAESVRNHLADFYELGIRHVFPIHNFDNGFGGTATWQDTIAIANAYSTNNWFTAEDCPAPVALNDDNGYGFSLFKAAEDDFGEALLTTLQKGIFGLDLFTHPQYPNTPSCNTKGLTGLGNFLIREMMSKKMIIDVDHMSIKSFDATLALAEEKSYPGIVASHALMYDLTDKATRHERMRTREQLQRIGQVGGMVAVMTQPPAGGIVQPAEGQPGYSSVTNDCKNSSKTWAQAYRYAVDVMTVGGQQPGVAFGTDFNGISAHNAPRFGTPNDIEDADMYCTGQDETTRVVYPFTVNGFGDFDKQVTGDRVFDFNTQGLAHIGLLPDMVEDLKKVGLSNGDLDPLFRSAETYIRMWEGVESTNVPAISLNDHVAPVTTITMTPAANANGWRNQDTTFTLTAVDQAEEGVEPSGVSEIIYMLSNENAPIRVAAAEVMRTITAEAEMSIFFLARDLNGNQEALKGAVVKLDKTSPQVLANGRTPANADNWNNTDVVAGFTCSDSLSGIDICTQSVTLTGEGAGQTAQASARDFAGNLGSATQTGINIDKSPPTITATRLPLANVHGWSNADVDVQFSCADAISGVKSCTSPMTLSLEAAGQSASGTAVDKAGNNASTTLSDIHIDKTLPDIVATQSPGSANPAGWYNTSVSVSFDCSDSLSGVDTCTPEQVLATDAADQSVTGTVVDKAGNQAETSITGLNIDLTEPEVTVTGVSAGAVYILGQVPAAGCTTTDNLSGVAAEASIEVTGGNSHAVGLYTASCDGAVDIAGNTGSASVTYNVIYDFQGFFSPVDNMPVVNIAKAGSNIPLKFTLAGYFGLDILAPGSPSFATVACDDFAVASEIEEMPATSNTGLTFADGEYHYNWKTSKSLSGSCRRLNLKLDDGTDHYAIIKFK